MIIVFNCPGCGAILRMKEQYGGQRGRCPHCQGPITVPAIASDEGMDLMPLEGGGAAPASAATPPAPKPPEKELPAITSRFAQAATPPSGGGAGGIASTAPSFAGDSNIGLAPLEEAPAKAAAARPVVSAAAPAPAPAPSKQAPPAADDDEFMLAPLEGGAEAPAKPAAAVATKPAPPASVVDAKSDPKAKSPLAADDRPRIVCAKCGTKMRVPLEAAGKQVTCPKCKNKQKIPEILAPAVAAAPTSPKGAANSDTISLADTPAGGADLGGGMLDMLGDAPSTASGNLAADAGASLGTPKLTGSKSGANTILGLPAIAVYAGAGVVTLGLIAVIAMISMGSGPSSTPIAAVPSPTAPSPNAPATASPAQPGAATPVPAASTPAAQPAATPAPMPNAQQPGSPMPAAPAAQPPTTPPAASPAAPPAGGGLRGRATAAAAASGAMPAEGGTPPAAAPSTGTATAPMPAATTASLDPAQWRTRVPTVRVQPDALPAPGDPPATGEPGEAAGLVAEIAGFQEQMLASLKQITDVDAARRVAPQWADSMARGLDTVRRLRLAGGPAKMQASGGGGSLRSRAAGNMALNNEAEVISNIDTELQRISQIAQAMPALEAALRERGVREPQGALAAALLKAGVPLSAGATP